MRLLLFSKMFQSLSLSEYARTAASLGFAGADLTVRPKGHIEPADVRERLPEACQALKGAGLVVGMLTTAITASDEPHAETVFAAAAECGVRFLKLGYVPYGGFGRLRPQIEEMQRRLEGIEALARRFGVTAGLHLHSGDTMSANPFVVDRVLAGRDPAYVGAYIDPGHMLVEGGLSGWKQGLDLLSDRIVLVAAKSFGWKQTMDRSGKATWRRELLPLRQGMVPWREVFRYLKQVGYDGYISVHSEYDEISLDERIAQTQEDVAYLLQCGKEGSSEARR